MDKTRDDSKPAQPTSAPAGAVYRADLHQPSIATPLLPVPKFPKLDADPVSTDKPATFQGNDHAQTIARDDQAVTLDLQTRQQVDMSPLKRPRRFNPSTGQFEEVELPLVDDAKPATARPVHDVNKAQNR